ncbi:MAG: hypothetical protein AABY22_07240 [Nanoarchaeota archaeon]
MGERPRELERRLSERNLEDKIDWKQWIPAYGMIEAIRDYANERASIMGDRGKTAADLWLLYQVVTVGAASVYLLNRFS